MTPNGLPARARSGLGYMTMRVYRVDRYGTVTHDTGRVVVPPAQVLTPLTDGYPPCACPRHRDGPA
ncbi:hypothetical protein ACJ6WF_16185 [Streptomyces sp. MMS24-I2-30]|uniref:hypothetical protein n=1 Tax=Streptomyces sp. MMS24-I2-30 TaxID=3351564 RepID=UPI003896DB06